MPPAPPLPNKSLDFALNASSLIKQYVPVSERHPIETVNGQLQDGTGLTPGESVVEVIIKRLDEKQYHPQDIEDDRYNTHNDDIDGHSNYPPFLHWNSSARKSVISVNRVVSRIDRLTDGKLVHGVMP